MKKIRYLLTVFLVLIAISSLSVITASASPSSVTRADVIWRERIGTFQKLNRFTRANYPYYTKSFQRFMYAYSNVFKEDIRMHGGIDGDFYTAAERCLKEFQRVESISESEQLLVNGSWQSVSYAGPETWEEIGAQMWDEQTSYFIFFSTSADDGDRIFRASVDSPYTFYYHEDAYEQWVQFHTP